MTTLFDNSGIYDMVDTEQLVDGDSFLYSYHLSTCLSIYFFFF